MLNLSKFGKKPRKRDILHSHSMARVASGETAGSTSPQSYAERKKIDSNRRLIRNYRYSEVHNPNTKETKRPKDSKTSTKPMPPRPEPSQRPAYREPTPRNYNPFS